MLSVVTLITRAAARYLGVAARVACALTPNRNSRGILVTRAHGFVSCATGAVMRRRLVVGATITVALAAFTLSANASSPPNRQLGAQIARTIEARSIDTKVFFPRRASADCTRVYARPRRVIFPAVLAGAIRALLAGPTTAERRIGYGGWFSRKTAGTLRSARIRNDVAYIDFQDFSRLIPNASSSCGSALLFAQLDRTVTQFPTVHRAVYSFNGSSRAFYEWLQREPPAETP